MEKVFKINVLNKIKSQISHNKKFTKIYCILDKNNLYYC